MKATIRHLIVILILTLINPVEIFSRSEPGDTSCETKFGRLILIKSPNRGKRIPPMTYIDCEVMDDMIMFDANFDYESMNVTVNAPNLTVPIVGSFSVFEPYIVVPSRLTGESTIRCTTDGGAIYEGTIAL